MNPQWTCSVCGAEHEGLPLDWGFDQPWYWNQERRRSRLLDTDLCSSRAARSGADHFVRGLIEMPIVDGTRDGGTYSASGSGCSAQAQFQVVCRELRGGRGGSGRAGGAAGSRTTCRSIPGKRCRLKTNVRLRGEGLRPAILVQPTGRSTCGRPARVGITLTRALSRPAGGRTRPRPGRCVATIELTTRSCGSSATP